MEFLLFDVSATCLFLLGYLTVVTLQHRRALPVLATVSRTPRSTRPPARELERPKLSESPLDRPTEPAPRREWPRLMYPR